MLRIVNGTEITKHLPEMKATPKGRKGLIMKNYMKTMVENYFVKNLVVLGRVGNEDKPADVLKRNSYTLLNVSPRFF